jgi:preprotein translocase subunit SecE
MSAMDQVRDFVKDVRLESAKVSWPTRDELRDSTIVVIVTVIMVAAFITAVDLILTFLVGLVIH